MSEPLGAEQIAEIRERANWHLPWVVPERDSAKSRRQALVQVGIEFATDLTVQVIPLTVGDEPLAKSIASMPTIIIALLDHIAAQERALAEARAEYQRGADNLMAEIGKQEREAMEARRERDEVWAALREATEALSFYADPETYFAIGFFPDQPCGAFIDDFEEIDGVERPGKQARAALTRAEALVGEES